MGWPNIDAQGLRKLRTIDDRSRGVNLSPTPKGEGGPLGESKPAGLCFIGFNDPKTRIYGVERRLRLGKLITSALGLRARPVS
jgi:hypothetical protein